jgi:hypothetical protein
MKKLILNLIILFAVSSLLHAQSFEMSVGASSGMFAYKGAGATANTVLIEGYQNTNNYVNNPYGSKYAFSYSAFIQPQYVFKSAFIIGLQGGYDILRSKTAITSVYPYETLAPTYYSVAGGAEAASGTDILQAQEIHFNPYIGYRINTGSVKLDVMPGMNFGFDLKARERGSASLTGSGSSTPYETNNKLPNLRTDVQLKLGVGAEWHRWSLVASYAYGLSDILPKVYTTVNPEPLNGGPYISNSGSDNKIHSSLFELGISYRLFADIVK